MEYVLSSQAYTLIQYGPRRSCEGGMTMASRRCPDCVQLYVDGSDPLMAQPGLVSDTKTRTWPLSSVTEIISVAVALTLSRRNTYCAVFTYSCCEEAL